MASLIRHKHFFKCLIDFCISSVILLLFSPFLSVVAPWLYFINNGVGAFFIQVRLCKNVRILKVT